MKSFATQFRECSAEGLTGDGEFKSFEDHPNMLPAFPKPELAEAIKNGELKGWTSIACLEESVHRDILNVES